MGWIIQQYQRWVFAHVSTAIAQRWAGIVLAVGLVAFSGLLSGALVAGAAHGHPWLGQAVATVLLASCFAGRSLRDAAEDVLEPLERGELAIARDRLRRYVGRDTGTLSVEGVYRALFETVTENAVDGVLAPLFYACLGAFLPLGPVPLAFGYKALSTLDSMVGYREEPYRFLGWFSARWEDHMTWLPCRCAVGTIALLSGQPRHVWKICRRDAPADPSPNAGWSECAYAAALGVQVGGINTYRGVVKVKPTLGDNLQPITAARIHRALALTRTCFLLWLMVTLVLWAALFQ